jgi:uncharacterized protein YbjT (DUF2867 family)
VTGPVLVAGGTGRLGSLVVSRLADQGIDVRVLTREPARAAHLAGRHVQVVTGDVRRPASLLAAVAGSTVVVSAVQGFAGPGGVTPASVDRDGNAKLIDAARAAGAHVVLMSIIGAAPDSPFELFRMKHLAESVLAASGVPSTIVRSSAFLELWIELLRQTAGRAHRPLVFGRGQNPINFVSVRDVAALVERAVTDRQTRGQTLEIGGPDNLTFTELARLVARTDGGTKEPRHLPRVVLHLMANTVGRLRPALGRQARSALAMDTYDMAVHSDTVRRRFPELPCTSTADVLG